MTKISFVTLALTLAFFSNPAQAGLPENLIAVGQGVSSPNTTSLVNVGRGLVGFENPAGLMYTKGFRFAAQMTKQTGANGVYVRNFV